MMGKGWGSLGSLKVEATALVAVLASLCVATAVVARPLAVAATAIAAVLTLARYAAIWAFGLGLASAKSKPEPGRVRGAAALAFALRHGPAAWLFPLSAWLALLGLMALLIILAGRKGLALYPAMSALAGPAVLFFSVVVRGTLSVRRGNPFDSPAGAHPAGLAAGTMEASR